MRRKNARPIRSRRTGGVRYGDGRFGGESRSVVEGADQGPVAGLDRGLAGLGARFLPLSDLPFYYAADITGIRGAADRSDRSVHDYLVDAAGRRGQFRLARRPRRPPAAADDLDPWVFAVQFYR